VLREKKATRLVVEHQDRLARFGVEYIRIACQMFGCEIIVINPIAGVEQDMMQDFVDIVTCFCARIYGSRRSKRKTEAIIKKLVEKEG